MKIVDFMVSTGSLSQFNYVLVENNSENIAKLKEMGCDENEISNMFNEDGLLDVYPMLHEKGYDFSPQQGFFKK